MCQSWPCHLFPPRPLVSSDRWQGTDWWDGLSSSPFILGDTSGKTHPPVSVLLVSPCSVVVLVLVDGARLASGRPVVRGWIIQDLFTGVDSIPPIVGFGYLSGYLCVFCG